MGGRGRLQQSKVRHKIQTPLGRPLVKRVVLCYNALQVGEGQGAFETVSHF